MKSLITKMAALVLVCAACATSSGVTSSAPAKSAPAAGSGNALSAKDSQSPSPSDAGIAAAQSAPPAPVELPPLPGEEVLNAQPALAPLADFAAPVPKIVTLKNGLRVYLLDKPGATIETVALVVKRGATSDPSGRAGLASLSAAMLEAGSAGKSQAEIAAAADALGATLQTRAATDATARRRKRF